MLRSKVLRLLVLLSLVLGMLGPAPARLVQAQDATAQATTIIAALSDYGSGETTEQTVATMIAGWNPAAIVTAGDNYHYQNCNSYETCVGNYYGSFVTAQTFYPTLGNHDYDNPPVGLTDWNNYFTYLPTNSDAQRRWYDVVVGDVHFFMLDANYNQSTQSTWLSTVVPASTSVWNIAVLHQAPYSTGYYGDIAASQMSYGTYGIDFVICGHNHHFERLYKADGGKDVRYFIDGYGGSASHSQCGTNTSAATSEFCLANTPGAIKITASDTSITFEYYSSAGVVQSTYTQDAEEPGPNIVTVGTLSPFSTTPGTPSAAQSYTVSGSLLTEGILITAPSGFEISTASGGPYSGSLTLPQSGGTVASTPVYVRLTGAEGTFSGNITHASAGATTRNVAVSGTAAFCYSVNLVAAEDTYLSANDVTYNNGGNASLHVNATTGTNRRTALLKWDLSGIPADATVSAASMTIYVSDASPLVFNLYNLRRSWVEGTSTQAASSTSANWNTYDGANTWGTGGAANTSSDRYDTNLWNATSTSYSTTGSKTIDLNANGVAVVQGWVAGTLTNYGVIMQTYSGTTNNALFFASSENSTVANRPKLNISYCAAPTVPTIYTSGTLSAFHTTPGTPSAAQSYSVSGVLLTEGILITAPTGFELATASGGPYSGSLTLPQSGGNVASTPIYVRLTGAAEGSFGGNITHTSAGATQKDVAASGTVDWCVTVSFQQGTAGYDGARDTHLYQYSPTYNYGVSTPLLIDSDEPSQQDNYDVSALLYWDISSIPAGSTISSASITVNVENVTDATPGFNLYAMLQGWTEGTGNGSATGNGATWNTYDGTNAWPGGAGGAGASDRGTTALANLAPTSTGSYQVTLNASALAVLEGWVNTPAGNNGFMIHAGTEDNGMDISSREAVTITARPKLTIDYCAGGGTGKLGDVNDDGEANSTDALIVLSADAGIDTVAFCPMNCGDVNSDGVVNSTDALIILSFDAGMSVPFPVETGACPSNVTPPPGCGGTRN